MPNWCHDTLTVTGEEAVLARFVAQAAPSEEEREVQPLSFASFAPEPDQAVYDQMMEESRTLCRLCGGKGKRPVTQEEAEEWGVTFYEDVVPITPFDQRSDCNGCEGKGQAVAFGAGWHDWRLQHWGTKWDANFSGPVAALAAPEGDVDASVDAQGVTKSTYAVVYKFDTAWSPPIEAVKAMSDAYPDLTLTLRFGEPGNGVAGEVIYEGGFCIEEKALEVDEVLAPEEMWF
jgi:hypothetical protein